MIVLRDIVNIGVTSATALGAGLLFETAGVPAPYLMGSLFGVWILGGIFRPLQPYLGIARWFHIPVVMGLAVLIGASFRPGRWPSWTAGRSRWGRCWPLTALATLAGMIWLVRVRRYPVTEAFLSSVPGGQAEILLIAREHTDKDYSGAVSSDAGGAGVFIHPVITGLYPGPGSG